MDYHDLTAAYALDALAPDEVEAYERHLAQCEECREQLAELNATASALAFGTVAPPPPPRLRAAILEQAAAERTNVIPFLQRRWVARGMAIAAAAAACIVVGLAVALSQSNHTRSLSVSVGPTRTATIHVSGLSAAPHGKTYEAWIIPNGRAPRPAGLFAGGASSMLHLDGSVPKNAVVAVTLERAGGAKNGPTMAPILSAPVS
jgi:anti-sigma-K factor RskA